jgi:hypothetical protein
MDPLEDEDGVRNVYHEEFGVSLNYFEYFFLSSLFICNAFLLTDLNSQVNFGCFYTCVNISTTHSRILKRTNLDASQHFSNSQAMHLTELTYVN